MIELYFKIFWLPTIASAVMLFIAGQAGLLNRVGRLILWFLFALVMQIVGQMFSPLWTIGLVVQVILAVYMAIQIKLG